MKRLKILYTLIFSILMMFLLLSCASDLNPAEPSKTSKTQSQTELSSTGQDEQGSGSEETPEVPAEDGGEKTETPVTVEDIIAGKNEKQPEVEFDGTKYRMRDSVSAYLLMGIDKGGEAGKQDIADDNGRNDANFLVVVDHAAKAYTTLQLNRDTMVPVDAITYYGDYMDTFDMRLCLAHFYGDGAEISCKNVVKSVSTLLGGIPISGYIAVQYDGIPYVNDSIGGVVVKITDDFSAVDPTMTMGETIVLNGKQAYYFVRSRVSVGDGLNTSREGRQRIYINAFSAECKREIKQNSSIINIIYSTAKPYMVTDMSLGTISNLAVKCADYTDQGVIRLPEKEAIPQIDKDGSAYFESYVDKEALTDLVKDLFYQKPE